MAVTVGAVYVDVLPTTRDFVKQMVGEILPDADKAGKEIGKKVGEALGDQAAKRAKEGIEEGVEDANVERTAGKKGRQAGAAFARQVRAEIEAALRNLPDVDIEADPQGALRDIARIREELEELRNKNIGVDLSGEGALLDLRRLRAELETLRDQEITVDLDFDLDQATRSLGKLEVEIEKRAERSLGSFGTTLRRSIEQAVGQLPDIEVDADTSLAHARLAFLREELQGFRDLADIDLDLNAANAIAEATRLQAALQTIVDDETIDIDVRINAAGAVSQLAAIRTAAEALEPAIDNALGDAAVGKVGRFRLILAAVAVLLPVIAAGVVALPGAIALMIGPAVAVAAGVDGIKKSFSELAPQVDAIQKATSAAFEEGLEPTIQRLQQSLPGLQDDLVRTADAITYVAEQVTRAATSAEGLNGIQDNFHLIDQVIRSAAPGVELFTENLIKLTTLGLQGMTTFGEEMRQVGVAWQAVIERLTASGAAEAAVRALFQILAELLNLAAALTEFGAVLGAAFGPALAAAISGLAQIFSTFAQALDSLPEPLQTIAGVATTVGLVMLVLGTRVTGAATAMRVGFVAAATATVAAARTATAATVALGSSITGLGLASRIAAPGIGLAAGAVRLLWAAVGGPIGLAIAAIVTALSFMGQGQSDAAAAADAHRVALEGLSAAIAENNGEIDNHILRLAREQLEASGAGAAAEKLGFSLGGMTRVAAEGGPAFDQLIAKLQEMANANVIVGRVATESGLKALAQKEAAQSLLDTLLPLRDTFADAAAKNADLARTLAETGNSLATGVGDASRLQEAFKTLRDEMADVKAIGDALYITMIQLSGQAIPLGLAQGQLGEAVRKTGEAFKAYGEETKKSGDKLLDHTGKINVASEAGYKLTQALDSQAKATYNSAAAAFDAAGGLNNIEVASAAAAREVAFSREAFIKLVGQFGITGAAAQRLADDYGLVPELVVTQLRAEGIPAAQQDILKLGQLVDRLPAEKTFRVGALTQEAITQLQSLGLEIRRTVDGGYEVVIQDAAARQRLAGLIDTILHPPGGQPNLPTGLNTKPAEVDRKHLTDGISHGDPAQQPTGLNTAPAQQDQQNLTGGINNADPAQQPTQLDTTKVQPQLDAIRTQALTTVATMPLNPIKGSGWDPDLAAIRDSVLQTVAQMPIDAMKSPNFDAQIQYIKTTLAQGIAATLPIDPVRSPNWAPALQAIKDSLTLPPYTAMLITVARAPTWAVDLAAITGPLMLPPYTAMLLVPGKAPTWQATLDAIRNELTLAPLIWQVIGDIQPILDMLAYVWDTVVANPLIWIVAGDIQPILDMLAYVWETVVGNPLIWVVAADATHMINTLIEIANWVASNPLYWQIIPVFSGFGGGGGGGGGGGSGMGFIAHGAYMAPMAHGGVIDKALTPMRNSVATVVPPNTWRVVGDRMHGDEAFIPIIDKARSHRILEYTASKMGRTILPQAQGSVVTQSMSGGMFAGDADWVSATPEGGSSWRDRQAPLIGQVVAGQGASATDLADEVMFRLRVADYGGVNGVRR